ncbi:MAG: SAM-dependent methyltransferase, partial [Candidatus Hodarchaeales archaeon]
DVLKLKNNLQGKFDIVYTSYGVLCWLPDLKEWANTISYFLEPDGFFLIVEDHPFCTIFEEIDGKLEFNYPYFYDPEPMKYEEDYTYAGEEKIVKNKITYEWSHPLSEILCSLIDAGLIIEYLHEFPHCCWQRFPMLVKDDEGRWWFPDEKIPLPMTFSLKAAKK